MNTDQLLRFVGNPSAYAIQQDDGSYKPVRKHVTGSLLKQHLAGEVTVGTYVGVGDQAKFIVFDVDTGDDAQKQAEQVVTAVLEMGVGSKFVGVEFSGRKGYHVWVPFAGWMPATELRRFGRAVLALSGVQCEVFPKQDLVRDLGNLVKLPGGKHRVSGMASTWVMDALPLPMPLSIWQENVHGNLPPETAGRRFNGGATERFPCLDHILNEGVRAGNRNNELFHAATMLRRAGLPAAYVELVLRDVNQKGDPLDPYELETCLAAAENSGPICDQVSENRQCGELCIRARTAGLYTRPRQLRNAAVGEKVVVVLAGRTENVVELEHDDLESAKGVLTTKKEA
jgi:hypothetical protein